MVKLNKGKQCDKYCIALIHRGHTKAKDIDVVVKLRDRIVERLGNVRWHIDSYIHNLNEDRFVYWISGCNIIYTKGFRKFLLKILNILT